MLFTQLLLDKQDGPRHGQHNLFGRVWRLCSPCGCESCLTWSTLPVFIHHALEELQDRYTTLTYSGSLHASHLDAAESAISFLSFLKHEHTSVQQIHLAGGDICGTTTVGHHGRLLGAFIIMVTF
jgi:hypothetical protein